MHLRGGDIHAFFASQNACTNYLIKAPIHTSAISPVFAVVLPCMTMEILIFSMLPLYINATWCSVMFEKVQQSTFFSPIDFNGNT